MALLTSLVAYYSMEGNSNDATGNGNNGTDTTISYNTSYGKILQGALFNGSSSNIFLSTLHPNTAADFSVSVWANLSSSASTAAYRGIFSNRHTSSGAADNNTNGWIELGTEGNLNHLTLEYGGGTLIDSGVTVNDDNFHHYVVIYTASNTTLSLYMDNSLVSAVNVGANKTGDTNHYFMLGVWDGLTQVWLGDIDEVGLWSRALTSIEVTSLYNGGAGLPYPLVPSSGNFNIFF